ncbi:MULTISPECIES: hypothetical protein [unclassified Moorena]|uniref:hypothetical protein n=1 Tax=unclassified Moorena TaxID=2683338 RepID=UPI0013FFF429|nr:MULTISPECIES: hypothetical protein [unclassified Moorena]NEO15315.1 hypothetical protein [Moorena sp. SIO3E8]NEQ01716.1 hypothetical protein [Moorena sp. SIO3F7]
MTDSVGFPEALVPIYIMASSLLFILVIEAFLVKDKRAWSIPALAVYATVGAWYFIELIYTPENFLQFPSEIIEYSYWQIITFLITFRLLIPSLSRRFLKNYHTAWKFTAFNPEQLLMVLAFVWLCLLGYGVSRLNGDIFTALFPIAARTGRQMWGRAAAAGGNGFIISSAGYVYTLVCAFFGVLLPLPMGRKLKTLNLLLVLIVLPYFIFLGARNQLLAVIMPGYFSYALFSRDPLWKKALITMATFWAINELMTLIITYRNIGFNELFNPDVAPQFQEEVEEEGHLGLNMLEELCYINYFYQEGSLNLTYGGRYLAEAANIIPRAIWPNKPLIGIEYAILRGFGGADNSIGVFATVSTGLIGQGFFNFGPILGPMGAAILMAAWASFMGRLWAQQFSTLRLGLFLICLGLTFNLGREFTLLVLWPALFGYVFVLMLERYGSKKAQGRFISTSHL